MFKILDKEVLGPSVTRMVIDAPKIAKKAQAGQFVILRVDEYGERVPFTVSDFNREKGTVTVIFQEVGATTMRLGKMNKGDYIPDVAGPLGNPTDISGFKKVCIVGGGLGTAIAYPQAKTLHSLGAEVTSILGFRSNEYIILENEVKKVSKKTFVTTDDGSNGTKGFVTDILQKLIDDGEEFDAVIAIGPMIMMKMVCELTRPYGIKTIISMNPIMIDGTGMCGGCRVMVNGKMKFACVDGPEFDGHLVDFDDAMKRASMYKDFEKKAAKHECRLKGE